MFSIASNHQISILPINVENYEKRKMLFLHKEKTKLLLMFLTPVTKGEKHDGEKKKEIMLMMFIKS